MNKKLVLQHEHLGGTCKPHVLWEMGRQNGMNLNLNYEEFLDRFLVDNDTGHDEYVVNKFELTHSVQSNPGAVYASIISSASKFYREQNVGFLELRFNPMLRNRQGFYDLDEVMIAACTACIKAKLMYGIEVGLIVESDRSFDMARATILAEKAVKYKSMGVVGFDVSGKDVPGFDPLAYKKLYAMLASHGLGTTMHLGELKGHLGELKRALTAGLELSRIGHGIQAYRDVEVMRMIKDKGICLEICPTSNIKLGVMSNKEMAMAMECLFENGIMFSINTDGSELLGTTMQDEYALVEELVGQDVVERSIDCSRLSMMSPAGE